MPHCLHCWCRQACRQHEQCNAGHEWKPRVLITLSPIYVWLAAITALPHKEERFMYVVYPLVGAPSMTSRSHLVTHGQSEQQCTVIDHALLPVVMAWKGWMSMFSASFVGKIDVLWWAVPCCAVLS